MEQKTQLAIIGAGPGGYTAAFLAADLGLEVSLIDRRKNPGGVCLYEGCIPSKAYLRAANVLQKTKEASQIGLDFSTPRIDLKRLRLWKEESVAKLTSGLGQLTKQRKINYLEGSASFIGPKELEIQGASSASTKKLRFENAILACGSVPQGLAQFPESSLIMDSSEALKLETIPTHLLVIGGGYIGLEMSSVYAHLGAKVSIVEAAGQLLPSTDPDLVGPLAKKLDSLVHKIYTNTKVEECKIKPKKVCVKMRQGDSIIEESFDKVLLSIGRKPELRALGLEKTSVQLDEKGFVRVNEKRQSTAEGIYAIGDISGPPMLAHKASYEAKVAVEAIHGNKGAAFDPRAIPAVVFTEPEIAYCGLMEREAEEQGYDIRVARFPWSASGRALTLNAIEGLTKMVMDKKSTRLLGVGIVGEGAGELIAEAVLAIEMGASAKDLALSIHPHPTLSESMMECSEIFFGQSTHVYQPMPKI